MGQLNRMTRALARSRSFAETYRGTWQGERYARRVHLLELVLSGRYQELVEAREHRQALALRIQRRRDRAERYRAKAQRYSDPETLRVLAAREDQAADRLEQELR